MDWFEEHYLPHGRRPRRPPRSLLRAGRLRRLPPAYVAIAGFDPLRDEGESYALRMRDAGTQVTLRRHPGSVHTLPT